MYPDLSLVTLQQEAVTLLESRSISDDALEEGDGDGLEAEGNEAEAEDAARALLGLPGIAGATGIVAYSCIVTHCLNVLQSLVCLASWCTAALGLFARTLDAVC